MTNYLVKNVDQFVEAALPEARSHLEEIRGAVKVAVPEVEEKIGYGKPYYKYHGWMTGFDVYTNHIGLEIWDGLSRADRDILEAKGYKTGSRTFQIRYDQKVPTTIIKKLVRAQALLNEAKAANKKK